MRQQFPGPGFVEMCPEEIYDTTLQCIEGACVELRARGMEPAEVIRAIGITNQRGNSYQKDEENEKKLKGKKVSPIKDFDPFPNPNECI